MPISARVSLFGLFGLLSCFQTACYTVPSPVLRQSQLQAQQLYAQNKSLQLQAQQSEQKAFRLGSELDIANRRIHNLNAERSQLKERYINLFNHAKNQGSPLSGDATRRFEELARKYPHFEFDPQTGVSKFHSDILFSSGSADIKSSAHPVLREFAKIMNAGDAKRLNILVVGHTDDKPISKRSTKSKHATNWHLSTNRADSVVVTLSKFGIKQRRMGAAGYSMHQPLVPNTNDKARQRNRRVEIFVLAPDAVVAGWDPEMFRK